MESDTERGVGSFGNDGEELSPVMTITSLNRGMDSIVAKAGTLSTLENIKGITSFERNSIFSPYRHIGPFRPPRPATCYVPYVRWFFR